MLPLIKVLILVVVVFNFLINQCISHKDTFKKGQYRVLSLEDGLYLTAGGPQFRENNEIELGDLTAEKWGNFREQRWDLIPQDPSETTYWILTQENLMNRLSAYSAIEKPRPNICDLICVEKNVFLIRSVIRDACIVNPGYGKKLMYAICDKKSRNQHWVLDFLGK